MAFRSFTTVCRFILAAAVMVAIQAKADEFQLVDSNGKVVGPLLDSTDVYFRIGNTNVAVPFNEDGVVSSPTPPQFLFTSPDCTGKKYQPTSGIISFAYRVGTNDLYFPSNDGQDINIQSFSTYNPSTKTTSCFQNAIRLHVAGLLSAPVTALGNFRPPFKLKVVK